MIDGLRRVERDRDSSHAQNRQVDDGPFGAIFGNQAQAVTGANSPVSQSQRDMTDPPNELAGGNVHPFFMALFTNCIRLVMSQDCFQTKRGQSIYLDVRLAVSDL